MIEDDNDERRGHRHFIDHASHDEAHKALVLLHLVDGAFAEALLALVSFEESRARDRAEDRRARWERETEERRLAEEQAWQGRPDPFGAQNLRRTYAEKRIAGDRLLTKWRWERGELPQSVEHRRPLMYARAFLFALDNIVKGLRALAQSSVPSVASQALADLTAALPDLTHVRNTAHHHEDRARGLGRSGTPLDLKPIDAGGIKADGGAIVLDNLSGSRYGCTVADGRFAEVDVTADSLTAARDAIQRVLDSIEWTDGGDPHRSPSV